LGSVDPEGLTLLKPKEVGFWATNALANERRRVSRLSETLFISLFKVYLNKNEDSLDVRVRQQFVENQIVKYGLYGVANFTAKMASKAFPSHQALTKSFVISTMLFTFESEGKYTFYYSIEKGKLNTLNFRAIDEKF